MIQVGVGHPIGRARGHGLVLRELRDHERAGRGGGQAEADRDQRRAQPRAPGGDAVLLDQLRADPGTRAIREPRRLTAGLEERGDVALEDAVV